MKDMIGIKAFRDCCPPKWVKHAGRIRLYNSIETAVVAATKADDAHDGTTYGMHPADPVWMLNEIGQAQKLGLIEYCPRCGGSGIGSVKSQHAEIMVCEACAQIEELESIPGTEMVELFNWAAFDRTWEVAEDD